MKFLSAIGFLIYLFSLGAAFYFSFFVGEPNAFMTIIWILFGMSNLILTSAIIEATQK